MPKKAYILCPFCKEISDTFDVEFSQRGTKAVKVELADDENVDFREIDVYYDAEPEEHFYCTECGEELPELPDDFVILVDENTVKPLGFYWKIHKAELDENKENIIKQHKAITGGKNNE